MKLPMDALTKRTSNVATLERGALRLPTYSRSLNKISDDIGFRQTQRGWAVIALFENEMSNPGFEIPVDHCERG
jgi:hypothetical protein